MDSPPSTIFLQNFLADPKNQELFGAFARKYGPRIKNICLSKGLNDTDADDLTADILLRMFERDLFDNFVLLGKKQFYSWLHVVVVHAVLTFIRNRNRQPAFWSLDHPESQESLARKSEEMAHDLESVWDEYHERVKQACDVIKTRVEEKTWLAFYMQVFEQIPVDEVAERLKMSKSSVWTARSRVLRLLREEMRDLFGPGQNQK